MNYSALIVDDETNVVELLTDLIDDYCAGLFVMGSTKTLSGAVQFIEKKKPDLVFLDINLPAGNGLQLLDHFPVRSFDVVFITGYASLEKLALKYKPIGVITKPVDRDNLTNVVEKFKTQRKKAKTQVIKNNNLL